jgi:hypothetical protein
VKLAAGGRSVSLTLRAEAALGEFRGTETRTSSDYVWVEAPQHDVGATGGLVGGHVHFCLFFHIAHIN